MSLPAPPSTADQDVSSTKRPQVRVKNTGFTILFSPTTNPAADVVFVHGLQGHPRETWTYSGEPRPGTKRPGWFSRKAPERTESVETVFWPLNLLPDDQNDIRIMTYGYDSQVTKFFKGSANQTNISEHGRSFLQALASRREDCQDTPIIFVAHSLGGLIVKEALRRSRDEQYQEHLKTVYTSTYATIFFGVPHRGSAGAGWGGVLRRIASAAQFNTAKHILADLDPSSGSSKLDELSDAFSSMLDEQNLHVCSFQESRSMVAVKALNQLVVPRESAALNEPKHESKDTIDANHVDMCKFNAREDAGYEKFMDILNRYMRQIRKQRSRGAKGSTGDALITNKAGTIASDGQQAGTGHMRSTGGNSPIFMVPYTPNPRFIGRKDILEQLEVLLTVMGDFQKRAALWGLGGVGKSQIAIAYAYWYQKRYPERSIFWIHASNPDRFSEGFLQISQKSSIPDTGDSRRNMLVQVRDWLKEKDRDQWLMIIDNADDTEMFFGPAESKTQGSRSVPQQDTTENLSQYIPDCAHGTILITTRTKKAAVKFTTSEDMIEVSKMGEAESVELMARILNTDLIHNADLSTLTALLEHLPLALAQAAAYIQGNSLSIETYVAVLKAGKAKVVDLLSQDFEARGREPKIPNAVAATWMISFDQIREKTPRAAELLSLMAFLDRQNIPQSFLLNDDEDPLDDTYLTACGELKAFSLITETATPGTFDMHRLVQMVTQRWLINQNKSEIWATKAAETVDASFPDGTFGTWNECAKHLPHAQAVIQHLSDFVTDQRIGSHLLDSVSTYLWYQGRLTEAEKLLMRLVDIKMRALGPEHPDTLMCISHLTSTYWDQGRLAEAEELDVKVMEMGKRALSSEHPDTLTSMSNLASVYRDQGRLAEAEELEMKVIEIRKRALSSEHPDTLTSMSNLASVYWDQGRLAEAEELNVKVMEMRKRALGSEHSDTLISMGNLAFNYWDQGRSVEAEELSVKVVEMRKRKLGLRHPDTLMTMENLAWTYRNQGHADKAISLMTEVGDLLKETHGDDHPHTEDAIESLEEWRKERSRMEAD